MPSIIRVLDEKTINKIAAGEVIENSSSCVKELIENALDAGATDIEIHIFAGGRKKIEVIDNGHGMNPDDALLCLERHATSKLRQIEDMETLFSMGFRGEALPSICSISKMTLTTSNGSSATKITAAGGKLLLNEVTSRPKGTTIAVESLFFNVPARREFQKSVTYDVQEVTKVVTQLALVHPEVGFRLTSDHKEIFNLIRQPSLDFLEAVRYRIQQLYGEELAQSLRPVNGSIDDLKVQGFISDIQTTRPNRSGQHFYINQRAIQSKLLSWALTEGYSTRLPQKRFPLAFLFLEINPQAIDVNVHPQKKEVRFKNPFDLKKALATLVDRALQQKTDPVFIEPKEETFIEQIESSSETSFTFFEPTASVYDQVQKIQIVEKEIHFPQSDLEMPCLPHVLGLFDVYIFVEAKSCQSRLNFPKNQLDGILIVHQKRARERLLFEVLVQEKKSIAVQNLLMPETLELSISDAQLVEKTLPLLNTLGISIRSLRGQSFILDGLPAMLKTTDAKNILDEVLADIRSFGFQDSIESERVRILAQAISKSVHLEKNVETPEEAAHLVEKLLKAKEPHTSPKGKPIIVVQDRHDLFKMFNK